MHTTGLLHQRVWGDLPNDGQDIGQGKGYASALPVAYSKEIERTGGFQCQMEFSEIYGGRGGKA